MGSVGRSCEIYVLLEQYSRKTPHLIKLDATNIFLIWVPMMYYMVTENAINKIIELLNDCRIDNTEVVA